MEVIELEGDPTLEIVLRRSGRARRLSLRVSSIDGRVTMTIPTWLPDADALAFAADRRDWIVDARSNVRTAKPLREAGELPVEGRLRQIVLSKRRSPLLEGDFIYLPDRAPGRAAAAFLKVLARDRLALACDRAASTLERSYTSLVLRDTRSRWGSCSQSGRLMFSWRLAMAPKEVLAYVAVHEVAHLVRMDHSPAFWSVVEGLDPMWRGHRDWLKRKGPELHCYLFND
ncbi:MAG: SprT family zinc-dependent metalloprotease [Pseudomonadota bacterium]